MSYDLRDSYFIQFTFLCYLSSLWIINNARYTVSSGPVDNFHRKMNISKLNTISFQWSVERHLSGIQIKDIWKVCIYIYDNKCYARKIHIQTLVKHVFCGFVCKINTNSNFRLEMALSSYYLLNTNKRQLNHIYNVNIYYFIFNKHIKCINTLHSKYINCKYLKNSIRKYSIHL